MKSYKNIKNHKKIFVPTCQCFFYDRKKDEWVYRYNHNIRYRYNETIDNWVCIYDQKAIDFLANIYISK